MNQKSLLSLIVGAAAGVAAGMLLAPYAGKESRRKIAETANSLKNEFGGQLEDTLNKLSEVADSALATLSNYGIDVTKAAKKKTDGTADQA